MQVPVYNMTGESVDKTDLRDDVFGIEPNVGVMHQAFEMQRANARQPVAHTKTRGEVRGGGRKPWPQKGTGRARHGSIRSPIWKGGGTVFGPTSDRSFSKKMPKKMRRLAYRSALSAKMSEEQVIFVDELDLPEPRTKDMIAFLDEIGAGSDALILMPEANFNVEKSAANLPDVKILRAQYLNVRDLLGYEFLVIPLASQEIIEDILGQD